MKINIDVLIMNDGNIYESSDLCSRGWLMTNRYWEISICWCLHLNYTLIYWYIPPYLFPGMFLHERKHDNKTYLVISQMFQVLNIYSEPMGKSKDLEAVQNLKPLISYNWCDMTVSVNWITYTKHLSMFSILQYRKLFNML